MRLELYTVCICTYTLTEFNKFCVFSYVKNIGHCCCMIPHTGQVHISSQNKPLLVMDTCKEPCIHMQFFLFLGGGVI